MPNYNDAQGVADLLSQFDFNIISEGPLLDPAPQVHLRVQQARHRVLHHHVPVQP